ncbi:hypothetical protein KQ302_04680 [Synechococcus sp. CS-602]|uniref:hypothetical protein n=1 Tax=Synechococcaceae TaxID=1890426 RepID=UPI0008FF3AA6|nr:MULTISPECIES: hypothetical protein [Synechococcaceae]MCT4365539.1 hypothetical protein [Candidatus Regnicoccus frigidus MAG-AL1]APD47452.1 hypothetical protein BM449_03045 [Synechococcus sp. SynAce01]MCT0202605.1 hypothetical protein [Synechococcus sp. CS-603]MCT0204409.1 hypothetical protein [Synechococcus sp. CS-602]MCT0247251.1 hypothetical protein [Synechococcus sp. CS-601]
MPLPFSPSDLTLAAPAAEQGPLRQELIAALRRQDPGSIARLSTRWVHRHGVDALDQLIREQAAEAPATQANALQLELNSLAGTLAKPLATEAAVLETPPPNPAEWEIKAIDPPATVQAVDTANPFETPSLAAVASKPELSTEDPFQAKASIGDPFASDPPAAQPMAATPSALDSFTADSFMPGSFASEPSPAEAAMASDPFAPLDPGPNPFDPAPLAAVASEASTATAISVTANDPAPGAETETNPAAIPEEGHPGSGSDGRPQRRSPIRRFKNLVRYCIDEVASTFQQDADLEASGPGATVQPPAASWPLPPTLPSPQPESARGPAATSPAVSRRSFSSQPPAERQPRLTTTPETPGAAAAPPVHPDLAALRSWLPDPRDDEERRAS